MHELSRYQFEPLWTEGEYVLSRSVRDAALAPLLTVAPVVAILGPVIDQQQDAGIDNRIGQQVEHALRLGVDPMQILENHDERLLQALAD